MALAQLFFGGAKAPLPYFIPIISDLISKELELWL